MAQSGFERVYGGADAEFGYSVRQCADGGYVLLGSTESSGSGSRDIYMIKTDAAGDTLWTRTFEGSGFDSGEEVELTTDGGFVLCGSFDLHSIVIKLSADGEVEWTTELPDRAAAIVQTGAGDFITTGTAWLGGADSDMFAARLTSSGDVSWTRNYGTFEGAVALADEARDISVTSDGGYILYGSGRFSFPLGLPSEHLMVKINDAGDTLWTRTYGGEGFEMGFCVEPTTDGGFILLGNSSSLGDYVYEWFKTDADGQLEWSKTLGGEDGTDEGYEIRQTPDGGYAFAAHIVDEDSEMLSVYLVKMDALGDTTWTRTFRQGQGAGIELTTDGGYAVVGFTASIGAGMNDMYLLKTDENGVIVGEAEFEARHVPQASVFPDPVMDRAFIRFPNPQRAEVTFLLFNALGQTINGMRCGATDRIVFERKGLPSGQYQFLISDGTKQLARGRLILK